MALPLSGPLSLLDIQREFGGPTPPNLNNYYKDGQYVTQYSYAPNVPASGPIAISDFYGAYSYQPVSHTVTLVDGQSFTIPSTIVGPVTLTVISASGGNGGNDVCAGYPGYPGHRVVGNVTVVSGDVLTASIGGPGGSGGSGTGYGGGGAGYSGVFGYAGGRGGNPGSSGWSGGGGGGGGATAVTQNGTPVIVAGGGAGGGGGGWHSAGRPTQGYISTGSIVGGNGQDKGGGDGGGSGGGGGGQFGGIGGPLTGGDNGAWSGDDGADLIPVGGSSTAAGADPIVVIQGVW